MPGLHTNAHATSSGSCFEDLAAWQEAARLDSTGLDLPESTPSPLTSGFRNQTDRPALSVSNHIAEGFGCSTAAP